MNPCPAQLRGLIQYLPLFTLVAEHLAAALRGDPLTAGYRVPGLAAPLTLTQYADDTTTVASTSVAVSHTMSVSHSESASRCAFNPSKIKGTRAPLRPSAVTH